MIYIVLFFIIFLFGAAIGSFISASVYRIRNGISTISGRSKCPKCNYVLGVLDLVPVFSFIGLGRKCRKCSELIAWEYLITELATGFFFIFIFFYRMLEFWSPDIFAILLARDWFLIAGFIFLFIYDLKYQQLPDRVTLPLIFIIFGINVYLGYDAINLLFAGAVGGWWFAVQYLVSRGRWVGDGDIRMGVLLGVALGFPNIVLALFVAYILGAFISVGLIFNKKKGIKSEIAFGTFLALGGFIGLYWGETIINWYLGLL